MNRRIELSRQGAISFLHSMEVEPFVFTSSSYNNPVHTKGMTLPATYNAVNCLRLVGEGIAEPDRLARFLNGFQCESGAYRIPEMRREDLTYPDFEYDDFHVTNYVLGALEGAGGPALPLSFLSDYDTPAKLADWLSRRDMTHPWTEGNLIVNLASFFEYTGRQDLFGILHAWHLENQDEHGYWHDPSIRDLTSAMAGAAHNLHLFYKLNQPVPRYRNIIDHCLTLPNEASTACIDVDVADILSHFMAYNYRTDEIHAYLSKKLQDMLDIQQPDGGFYDTTAGERLFDGWSVYREPQGLSNCFATWFRMITIGMCARIVSPGSFDWHFRRGVGIGYCQPLYLHGGFTEPVEHTARQYGSSDEIPAYAGCSQELLALMKDISKRFSATRLDFACAFHLGRDGAFTLDLRDGTVHPGGDGGTELTLTLSLSTLQGILDGRINPAAAYALRRLKLKGDMSRALKLVGLLGTPS